MIAQELEVSLHMAFMDARRKRHEFHQRRASAACHGRQSLRCRSFAYCGANLDQLKKQLPDFKDEHTP